MSVSLLVKFLISFPKLAEAFRGVMDAYEERLYMERHNNMRGAIDEWIAPSQADTRRLDPRPLFYVTSRTP